MTVKMAIMPATWRGYAEFTNGKFRFEEFLEDAADSGYAGVEIGGGEERLGKPDVCRRLIESHGLQIAAYETTVTYAPWPQNTEEYRAAVRYAAELGVYTLVVCGGFLPNQRRSTYAFDYDTFAGNLSRTSDFASKSGVQVAFHPHLGSIVETIAETKEMLKRLPSMKLCADIAHLEASGEDAAKFIQTLRKQIIYTHIKDYSWKLDSFVELGRGDGKLNVAACVRELRRSGYDGWLTVALDKKFAGERPRTPLDSAKMCRRYLKRNCGI